MASQYARLLDLRALTANQTCDREQVLDLGAFQVLQIDPRIIGTGAGNLIIETASVNEEGAWRTIATIPLNTASALVTVSNFLRYVRWRTDGTASGTALVDVVAKGS